MIQKLLTSNKELLDFVENEFKPKIIEKGKHGFKEVTIIGLIGLFAKSTKTFRALYSLCHQHYGEDAGILARSLLENVINLAYIKGAGKRRLKLFVLYSFIAREKILNNNSTMNKQFRSEFYRLHTNRLNIAKAFYKKECARIKKKYGKCNNSWSCLSIKNMCETIGKKFKENYYDTVYWQLCKLSHPDVDGLNSYFYEDKDGFVIKDLPNETLVKESLVLGFDCYFKMLCLVNEMLRLGFKNEIESIEKKYTSIFGK